MTNKDCIGKLIKPTADTIRRYNLDPNQLFIILGCATGLNFMPMYKISPSIGYMDWMLVDRFEEPFTSVGAITLYK